MTGLLPEDIAVVVLGPTGGVLGRRLRTALPGSRLHGPRTYPDDWDESYERAAAHIGRLFEAGHTIVGVCAAGILIRSVAPFLAKKREEPAVVAVAEDGAVVGTAELHPNLGGPGAHIANAGFMVDPAHAGRGVGRALAEHTIGLARADGYRAMQFNAVASTNTVAVALWQSLGFEILATVPEGFHHPDKGYVGLHIMYRRL